MYDDDFYAEEGRVARAAAEIVLPWIFDKHPDIGFVVDIGCGTGEWAKVSTELGHEALGVDYHVPESLRPPTYAEWDLATIPFPCTGYDLALCLEVAEHLPDEAASNLVWGLAKAGLVLFSAATPGQPGINHINCQPHDYWHAQFAQYGLTPTHIGPLFDEPVADFYRRNLFLYERAT